MNQSEKTTNQQFEISVSIFTSSLELIDWNSEFIQEFKKASHQIKKLARFQEIVERELEQESQEAKSYFPVILNEFGKTRSYKYSKSNCVIKVEETKTEFGQLVRIAQIIPSENIADPDVRKLQYASIQTSNGILALKRRAENELKLAKEAAEASNRAKSNFLTTISHEIRTPLNGVLGMTSLLIDTELNKNQFNLAKNIEKSSLALLSIINDILDISKIEAGKFTLENSYFDLVENIELTANTLYPKIREKLLSYKIHIDPSIRGKIYGDPIRIGQILLNLISNAVKFTNTGFVEVNVKLKARDNNNYPDQIRFEVLDTGIGIKEDSISILFKNFSQADSSISRSFGGTGLGLSISKNLVNLMGGEIGVSSEIGKGSLFWFEIPVEKEKIILENKWVLPKYKTLLFMPEDESILYFKTKLESMNLTIEICNSIEEFLIYSTSYKYIFVDVNLFLTYKEKISALYTSNIFIVSISQQPEEIFSRIPIHFPILREPFFLSEIANLFDKNNSKQSTQKNINPLKSSIRVLVAEDDEINQELVKHTLRMGNYEFDIVENGYLALEAVKARHYDLIIMDIQMPEMDGIQATKLIRELKISNSKIPIIAFTADAMTGAKDYYLKEGFSDYVSKPLDYKTLIQKIKEITSQNR